MRENYKKKGQNWDDIGADFTRKQSEPSDDEGKCLAGCVIMIAKKISQMNKELESIVEELGGEISHHLDEATTHYVFQGKQREATKEFKQAKEMGKIIVAPEWIYMCRSEERKVGEAAFPYTYNPSKLVNQSTMHKTALNDAGSAASNKTKSRLTKAKLPQPDFQENEETKLDDEEMDNDHENNETLAADTTVPMDTYNQSTIPGSATKLAESGYKKSFKELQSLAESLKNSPALSIVSSVKKQKQNNKADTSLTDTTPLTTPQKPIVADEKEKESQVIWLDPEEQKNKEAMALKLSMETPDLGSINFSENMTAAFDTSMDNNSAANKIFTITSGIDESKAREIVESLGSVLDIEIGPDNLPTHVIVGKVSRSEKMLLCIASGRWILHASYLEESKKAGRWLQEENYELGNPDNTFLDLTENTTECKMSIAARKRRLEASRPGARPVFADLITYLALPSHKQGPFLRLIKAGGGTVVDELTSENMRTLTHVITENKYYSLIEGKSSQLCELSIPIIAPIYLNDYLINEALPLVENYLAENYKPKWEESKRTRGRNSSFSSDTTTTGRRKRRTNS